jgi:predicted N-acetyltransferase YhbS
MIIRPETEQDYASINEINCLAFNKESDDLVEKIRQSREYIPKLSLVAALDGEVVGHVMFSKAKIVSDRLSTPVLALGPIAVRPEHQKQGIGSALIRHGMQKGTELNYPLVLLIGHPSYYPRFGFQPARALGFELRQFKVSDNVFMVCELIAGSLQAISGEMIYSDAFLE